MSVSKLCGMFEFCVMLYRYFLAKMTTVKMLIHITYWFAKILQIWELCAQTCGWTFNGAGFRVFAGLLETNGSNFSFLKTINCRIKSIALFSRRFEQFPAKLPKLILVTLQDISPRIVAFQILQ